MYDTLFQGLRPKLLIIILKVIGLKIIRKIAGLFITVDLRSSFVKDNVTFNGVENCVFIIKIKNRQMIFLLATK